MRAALDEDAARQLARRVLRGVRVPRPAGLTRAPASGARCSPGCWPAPTRGRPSSRRPTSTPGRGASTRPPAGSTWCATCASPAIRGPSRSWRCPHAGPVDAGATSLERVTDRAVVVGAGHNGLVAACYLARAGLDVEVVERDTVVGGAVSTVERFPGYRMDRGSSAHIMVRHTGIVEDLDLDARRPRVPGPRPVGLRAVRQRGHPLLRRPRPHLRLDRAGLRQQGRRRLPRLRPRLVGPQRPRLRGLPGRADDDATSAAPCGASGSRPAWTGWSCRGSSSPPPTACSTSTSTTSGSRPRWPGWARSPARRPTRSPPPTSSAGTPSCTSSRRATPRAAAACSARRCSAGSSRTAAACASATAPRRSRPPGGRDDRRAHRLGRAPAPPTLVVAGCHVLTTVDLLGDGAPGDLAERAHRSVRTGNGIGMVVRLGTTALPTYAAGTAETHRSMQLLAPSRQALRRAHGEYSAGLPPDRAGRAGHDVQRLRRHDRPARQAQRHRLGAVAPVRAVERRALGRHPRARGHQARRGRRPRRARLRLHRRAHARADAARPRARARPAQRPGDARRDGVRPDVHVAADARARRLPPGRRRRALPLRRLDPPRRRRLRRQRPVGRPHGAGRPQPRRSCREW